MEKAIRAYENLEQATDTLRSLNEQFNDHIAMLRRNEIYPMLASMSDEEFESFALMNVPALMAWCAANKVPLDSGVAVRRTHSMLANHENLKMYFDRAVEGLMQPRRPEADRAGYKRRDYARKPEVYDRLCRFLEQFETAGAFATEISRAELDLLDAEA
ncbi:MAG TPA: hypothetical protein VF254_07500 [Gammaproteobacteria bacterium]